MCFVLVHEIYVPAFLKKINLTKPFVLLPTKIILTSGLPVVNIRVKDSFGKRKLAQICDYKKIKILNNKCIYFGDIMHYYTFEISSIYIM